jgi:hypothetical protein
LDFCIFCVAWYRVAAIYMYICIGITSSLPVHLSVINLFQTTPQKLLVQLKGISLCHQCRAKLGCSYAQFGWQTLDFHLDNPKVDNEQFKKGKLASPFKKFHRLSRYWLFMKFRNISILLYSFKYCTRLTIKFWINYIWYMYVVYIVDLIKFREDMEACGRWSITWRCIWRLGWCRTCL